MLGDFEDRILFKKNRSLCENVFLFVFQICKSKFVLFPSLYKIKNNNFLPNMFLPLVFKKQKVKIKIIPNGS